jgi:hypothetical protein
MGDTTEPAKGSLPAAAAAPADDLGEGGKRALEAERKARREAERQLQELQAQLHERELDDLRRDVASAKNLTPSQARRLVGATREELEADADDLIGAFRPPDPSAALRGRPVEKLVPGAVPTAPEPFDAGKVADKILGH